MRMPVADIRVGVRDRADLGDLAVLQASITAIGLLHPVVVTEAGDLVAGGRRLAAVRGLGWESVPVTVVSFTTAAEVLRAEEDENTCRKPLTAYEAAQARERRARLLAPVARAQQAEAGQQYGRGMRPKASPNLGEASGPGLTAVRRRSPRSARATRRRRWTRWTCSGLWRSGAWRGRGVGRCPCRRTCGP